MSSFCEFRDALVADIASVAPVTNRKIYNFAIGKVEEFDFDINGSRLSLAYNVPSYEQGHDVVTAEWLYEPGAQPVGRGYITKYGITEDIEPQETPELDAFLASFKIN